MASYSKCDISKADLDMRFFPMHQLITSKGQKSLWIYYFRTLVKQRKRKTVIQGLSNLCNFTMYITFGICDIAQSMITPAATRNSNRRARHGAYFEAASGSTRIHTDSHAFAWMKMCLFTYLFFYFCYSKPSTYIVLCLF